MKRGYQSVAAMAAVLLLADSVCPGQAASDKKSYTFHGKVEVVDEGQKTLEVNGEKIEGWMVAMSMVYYVDDPTVVKKVKPGDQITATVYNGDYAILHKVQVVPKPADQSKSKK